MASNSFEICMSITPTHILNFKRNAPRILDKSTFDHFQCVTIFLVRCSTTMDRHRTNSRQPDNYAQSIRSHTHGTSHGLSSNAEPGPSRPSRSTLNNLGCPSGSRHWLDMDLPEYITEEDAHDNLMEYVGYNDGDFDAEFPNQDAWGRM